ncbi:MAG: UDP-3-O-acyl-N-acetylglucosamine deacetylase [Gammaproteobacteria bacterium]|jgi:UDP-3-O-[3-hydroxymyristoyl] N-acetylglucosamine deacetylase|nr:UDP-3-O-acyl-N-acetylglucosamine deacetylase [Gammaproteobacteria bacterium]MBT3488677.1 UDP-3-O-acyl-N-acetylglucosamine deacetylase [Gammaproteobacteria bacterium]MBT3719053.1 UDP-3-O-acyl-N-acetylglucosamine deacetylase [Gammaproteobacteria bacterium]MBT3844220.1 UDP-3-O-acyl-N-acetylglucosamine deacetylase [Gammaproteobacteria bacterium]MBT4301117.1 UDP-3-O-acyl-N-acetylglucosamine deacetylase [Gammaproteobacteria bacterium]
MTRQRTLKNQVHSTGIGLHSGKKVHLTLRPAPENTGIVFRRIDLPNTPHIAVCPTCVGDTRLSTTLMKDGATISTIEHLMSAFYGMGVDNAFVDLDAPEIPIMDGSASTFVFMLKSAGLVEQVAAKRYIRILEPIEVKEGDKYASLKPYNGFSLSFEIDFQHPAFSDEHQTQSIDFSSLRFEKEISRARTFGFIRDVETLRMQGLAQGASLENAVGLDEFRVLNEDGLRFKDEFVRHKILDAVGDLYLLGSPILGAYHGHKSGHDLNNQLTRKVLSTKSAWEFVTFDDSEPAPISFIPLAA